MKQLIASSCLCAAIISGCAVQQTTETEIIVAPNKISYSPGSSQQYFLVKRLYNGSFLPYDVDARPIENFVYQPGYRYRLSVTDYGYLPGVIETKLPNYYRAKQVLEKVPDSKIYKAGDF